MFWLHGHLGSYNVVGVLDTSANLTISSLKSVQTSGVSIPQDYPDLTPRVRDCRTTRAIGMVILIIDLRSQDVGQQAYNLDTCSFELLVSTDVIVHHLEVGALTLTPSYHFDVDDG